MKLSSTVRNCARYTLFQPSTQQLCRPSNHLRSNNTIQHPCNPRNARAFSATSLLSAEYRRPPPSPPNHTNKRPINPMQNVINDVRSSPQESPTKNPPNQAGVDKSWTAFSDLFSTPQTPPPSEPAKSQSQSINDLFQNTEEELAKSFKPPPIHLRLRPTLGRTVEGLNGDPTRGFRLLERKCNENNIRVDMRSQEKHVRRGQKKKNLRSMRWRKLFMEGFKAELDRVARMRKQGW